MKGQCEHKHGRVPLTRQSMSTTNRFELSRDIPADVARAVRQRCGFGCVVCGCAIYQYEHFDPPFNEATTHTAEGIILLCGGCHDRKTRGLLSRDTVAKAARSPKALERGFSFGPFDVGADPPVVALGAVATTRVPVILRAFGTDLLQVSPPEEPKGPFRLGAFLTGRTGQPLAQIVENEWRTPVANWDVEVIGRRISVRLGPGDLGLVLRCEPPRTLVVERLDMFFRGVRIQCSERDGFVVARPDGQRLQVGAANLDGCLVGVDVGETQITVGLGGGSISMSNIRMR